MALMLILYPMGTARDDHEAMMQERISRREKERLEAIEAWEQGVLPAIERSITEHE